jgi:LPXTG-motif cell wall-anchored protein
MKKTVVILLCLLFAVLVKSQKPFTTIIPQAPVVVGEAFQVQYVVENGAKASNFTAPVFQGFRIVSGPNVYSGAAIDGNIVQQSKNFVFTLVALNPGRLVIPGAVINIDGRQVRSNNSFIEVLSKETAARIFDKETASNSDYFLRPGENVQDKIRQNLFLKIMVDKRNCFVGEPVLAIFKLYSRLESKSDIVKNPGFYGFTVHDMVNLADKQVATETLNGKPFDVHTIRKVQLYPLQAGVFTIDGMEVTNKVEFSRSIVNKKTEQEIVEGILTNDEPDEKEENKEEFESNMSTAPVTINVKPLPTKNKPALFDGATGFFTISAKAVKNKLLKDEGDVLEIAVKGKGNFVQLNAPVIQWPKGIEGFEPLVKDSLDKTTTPLTGSRIYRYAFVAASAGEYTIPAINFSFFNPDSGVYKTITTTALQVSIDNKKFSTNDSNDKELKKTDRQNNYWFIGGGIVLLFSSLFWFIRKRRMNAEQVIMLQSERKADSLSVKEVLVPTSLLIMADDKTFYAALRQSIWNYFEFHFNFSGSGMSKENIVAKLNENKVNEELITEMKNILQQCEAGLFTNANLAADKTILLDKAKDVLEKLDESLL